MNNKFIRFSRLMPQLADFALDSCAKKYARDASPGRILISAQQFADQADIAFTRADRRETFREPVLL